MQLDSEMVAEVAEVFGVSNRQAKKLLRAMGRRKAKAGDVQAQAVPESAAPMAAAQA